MPKGILGKKVGMTQVFNSAGHVVPVTVVEAGPCVVVQIKTEEKDGYNAVQLGLEEVKKKKLVNKPLEGHFVRAGINPQRYLREIGLMPGRKNSGWAGPESLPGRGEGRCDRYIKARFCRDKRHGFQRADGPWVHVYRRPGSPKPLIRREYLKDGNYPGGWWRAGHHSRA